MKGKMETLLPAFIFLCCGILLSGKAVGEDQPKGTEFQIQQTLIQILGEQDAARYQEILSPEKPNSWEVYFPDNDSTEVPGVMVYVSPQKSGEIDSRWRAVMNQQNLIYIAANNSGNRIPVDRRMVLAIMALRVLEQRYLFAGDRINVSGFSGGGRVASMLASQYPEIFTGALYICGVDFWRTKQTAKIERLLQNRFVFLTGAKDFNRDETRKDMHDRPPSKRAAWLTETVATE